MGRALWPETSPVINFLVNRASGMQLVDCVGQQSQRLSIGRKPEASAASDKIQECNHVGIHR